MKTRFKEYSVETEEQVPICSSLNKHTAVIKCLFTKKAMYVFEFEVNEEDEYELIGCVFSKGRWLNGLFKNS